MKKLSFFRWSLLLILSYFVGKQVGLFFGRETKDNDSQRVELELEKLPMSSEIPSSLREHISSLRGAEQIEARLLSPYPKSFQKHSYAKEQEMIYRLRLLQELAVQENSESVFKIYEAVLQNRNEEWMIQRQVLKNIQPYWHQLNEKQRDRLLSQADLRARNTWQLSDRELVQLFESTP
jgi:hypothetical protein